MYLLKIAEYGSMHVAGEKLHISQQALSLAVKSLEREFNARLLDRSHLGVVPTEDGQRVIEMSKKILRIVEETQLAIQKANTANLVGEIHCLIAQGLNFGFFPKRVSRFCKEYPDISLNIQGMHNIEVIKAVEAKQCDIGLINFLEIEGEPIQPQLSEALETVFIKDYHLQAIVHKESPLARYKQISMSTLLKEPIIVTPEFEEENDYLMIKLLRYYGEPKLKWANSSMLARQMVIDKHAVCLAPKDDPFMGMAGMENTVLIPIKNKFSMKAGYIRSREQPVTPVVQAFIDLLIQ